MKRQWIKSIVVSKRQKVATQLAVLTGTWKGVAIEYELNVPIDGHKFIIGSAVHETTGPWPIHETYFFPSDGKGSIINWNELSPSRKDTTEHDRCLLDAGYDVIIPED